MKRITFFTETEPNILGLYYRRVCAAVFILISMLVLADIG